MTKTKSTKRALLASASALILCVSMLVGSTFAWFTDSVTTAGNTIQSGTLKVDLVDKDGNSLENKILAFVDLDQNNLWEPGCTYKTQEFFVKNNGNLALQYQIAINGIEGNAKLLEAIDWTITVDGAKKDIADLKGTLLQANETSKGIVLSGHMKEEAGNEYQGLTVEGISVSVFATQYTHESDSKDNQYDKNARLEYTYDNAKTAKENAAGLQSLIDTAVEGATIVVPAGTYDVSGISGNQIKLTKDNVTLLGTSGVIINDDGETGSNTQAVIKITGDNVTVSNIYATDKGTNTVILAFGNNVTINNCTLRGYAAAGHGQYLEAGVMIVANDVVNHPITKYTVTNNTFIDCNISLQNGVGNGGKAEDLIISGNTFKNAAVFVEHNQTNSVTGAVESWHVTDILVLPTIKNNLFESPSVWLSGGSPFAMYLRVYRDNDVATMTPATYWTDFVANNTIMEYTGEILSTDGKTALTGKNGIQMRPNGKVQYYGLNFANAASDAAELKDALANGGEIVLSADVTLNDAPLTVTDDAVIDTNGHTISGIATNASSSAMLTVKSGATLTLTGDGVISFGATTPDTNWGGEGQPAFPGYANNTIKCEGKLVVDGVTIKNVTAPGGASYAIDCYQGSDLVVNSGVIDGVGKCAIRMFCNSNTLSTNVTVNGGTITGKRAIWVQLPGNNINNVRPVNLTINGGELFCTNTDADVCIYSYSYGDSFANTNIKIAGGTFTGDVCFGGGKAKTTQENVTITGGTFNGKLGRYLANDGWEDIAKP